MTFLNSILNQSKKHEFPFDHWEYDNALSNDAIKEVIQADIPDVSKHNYGYLFTSGPNTWHGMEKKKIVNERRCIQVNYVTFKTDWKVNI